MLVNVGRGFALSTPRRRPVEALSTKPETGRRRLILLAGVWRVWVGYFSQPAETAWHGRCLKREGSLSARFLGLKAN